jgi:hypothetical protein
MTIQTDASCKGWGAVCNNVRIGGLWLTQESHFHINVLELMAIQNAVKSFLQNKSNTHVLIQTDNKTALAYLNRMGGCISQPCSQVAIAIWEWCLERNIFLHAEFIPGKDNLIADWESRHHHDSSSWMLNPHIFQILMNKTQMCTVDLFADRTNAQLTNYMSWFPDPEAIAVNALIQPWDQIKGYAFPPFSLIGRCLQKIRTERATVVLVTPAWSAQPWYATLLEMSIQDPILLPIAPQTLQCPTGEIHPLLINKSLQLVGWVISGNPSAQWNYQSKLKNCYSNHGAREQTLLTTQPGISGLAGVWKEKLIPFRLL